MSGPYDDILDRPRPVWTARPPMSAANRAAQFAPFSALTGYDLAIVEAARRTDRRIELDSDAQEGLRVKLSALAKAVAGRPEVSVTFFEPDGKKAGGKYVTVCGAAKKLDDYAGVLVLEQGRRIKIADILDIDGAIFAQYL